MADEFDVIVIGGGAAGENVAGRTSPGGLTTVLVESELVGGECSYWACMPSKALLRPGEALAQVARVPGAREAVTGQINVAHALTTRDAMINHLDDAGQVSWLESVNTPLYRGMGRLAGPKVVNVTAADGSVTTLTARNAVVVATGTTGAVPPIEGLASIEPWYSREVTTAKEAPRRLLILGGGAVGVEMAQAWKWLGSQEVTVVEAMPRLLPKEEPVAGELLADAFAKMGINVLTGTMVTKVSRSGSKVTVTLNNGSVITTDQVLVAIGRRPTTTDIGLESVGLEPGQYIQVDDQLRATGVEGGWLYAVGDVNGRALLTHQGKYQARIAGDAILGKPVSAWADHGAVPRIVFTDPQVAAVGLTEAAAREAGMNIRVVSLPLGSVAGTSLMGEQITGTVQIMVDEDRRVIVGATFVGPGVAELLHAATIAIAGEVTLDQLWHAVPSFPTVSEVWLRFLESYGM